MAETVDRGNVPDLSAVPQTCIPWSNPTQTSLA